MLVGKEVTAGLAFRIFEGRPVARGVGDRFSVAGGSGSGTVDSEVIMMRSITVRLTGILFAFALVSLVSSVSSVSSVAPCVAQQRPPQPPGKKVDDVFRRPVFLPPDRQTLRMLATAQALSDQGRYSQAVRLLQKILGETADGERNEDSFISSDGNKRVEGDGSQSLKRAA